MSLPLIAAITVTSKLFLSKVNVTFKLIRNLSLPNPPSRIIPNRITPNRIIINKWEAEKTKFLYMTIEERRKVYHNYTHLDDILSWAKYAAANVPLPGKTGLSAGFTIDSSKNASLADKVAIFRGDITTLEIDVIVNAANSTLLGGGGVDGAIHRKAGSDLKDECRTLGNCPTGEARLTGGYRLPAKYVIHTVGPQGEKPPLLAACYKNSLTLVKSNKLRSVAFPCISTGIYGYPQLPAAHIAAGEVRKYLEHNAKHVDRIIFCVFLQEDELIYKKILQSYFPLK